MKNESGEFELVLGNKQVLSGFFIVVILFGVFFVMGYILGRNSAPAGIRAAGGEQAAAAPPVQADSRPPALTGGSPAATAPETGKPAEEAPPVRAAEPETQPAREPEERKPATAAAKDTAGMAVTEPEAGQTYLQVMAVRRPEAEVVARTLKDRGFPATLGPGPNDLLRVLVGPYKDAASLGAAKAELENAGFHPMVRR